MKKFPDRRQMEQDYEARRPAYEEALHKLAGRLLPALRNLGIHPTLKVRVKSFASYFEKTVKKLRRGEDPEAITDLLGLRIVCPFLEDLRRAETLLRSWFPILEIERKTPADRGATFGYESTHFLVQMPEELAAELPEDCPRRPVEIQVRTLLQDAWAEAEHELIYKAKFAPFDQPLKRKLAALAANLTLSDIIFQEIRDYQRQLSRELENRKKIFLHRLKDQAPGPLPGQDDEAPSNIDQLLLEGLHAHNNRHYKKAINCYTAILRQDPTPYVRSLVLVHRGMAYFVENLYENALGDFAEALVHDSRNSKAHYYRGIVWESLEESEKAVLDFEASLALVPYQFDTLLARSKSLARLGRWDEAWQDVNGALALLPDDAEALQWLAELEHRRGSA